MSWIEDWLASVCESEKTRSVYILGLKAFMNFCHKNWNRDFSNIVVEWREARRKGIVESDKFLEEWNDIVRSFYTNIKPMYAPLTVKNFLTVLKSFFRFWNIPLSVNLPKRACVIYHNRDLKREEIRQILTYASARDRVIWLLMAESGMRAETAVGLKYWQIKEDFEANRVPLCILLPSASLKDHVGDRFTFIGEDGFRELKEYLRPRMPLNDDDYVFASEKAGKVRGEQFSVASLSVKFNRLVQKLGLDKSRDGKPKPIRMHGLRKYFRNNLKGVDSSYIAFWMGHSLGVDAHYISRDVEAHRREYEKGYDFLRVFEPTFVDLKSLVEQVREKDLQLKSQSLEIERLKEQLKKAVEFVKEIHAMFVDHTEKTEKEMRLFARNFTHKFSRAILNGLLNKLSERGMSESEIERLFKETLENLELEE